MCDCPTCREAHREFFGHFGHWPTMSHEETQRLIERREDNAASFDRMIARCAR
jgi:hypothetical protein